MKPAAQCIPPTEEVRRGTALAILTARLGWMDSREMDSNSNVEEEIDRAIFCTDQFLLRLQQWSFGEVCLAAEGSPAVLARANGAPFSPLPIVDYTPVGLHAGATVLWRWVSELNSDFRYEVRHDPKQLGELLQKMTDLASGLCQGLLILQQGDK